MHAATRPNVLLVVLDTARADAFEPYGAPPGASPAVRQLASRGHAYEAFSAAPWTIPSHAAMFSGLLPRATGMPPNYPEIMEPATRAALPALEERWLPSVLARAGYHTAGISTNPLVSENLGFDMGFAQFENVYSSFWCTWTGRVGWALQALRARADGCADGTEWLFNQWLSELGGKPFFWFVNLTECHSPYVPARPHNTLSPYERVRASQEWGRFYRHQSNRTVFSGSEVPAAALSRMRRLYAAEVLVADRWLARLLESLDARGLLDETIVIVTSDHGENFGEGGLLAHGYSVDDRLIRVPFVVTGPAAAVPGPLFSLVDLPSWIAASCGIQDSPWPELTARTIAVAQFEPWGEPADPWIVDEVSRWGIGDIGMHRLTDALTCATNGRRKLVQRGSEQELYDLDADPLEQSPVTAGGAAQKGYVDEVNGLRQVLEYATADSPVRPDRNRPSELSAAERAELEARMKMLGYM
jgi:arylsulfatase A-like enzyme